MEDYGARPNDATCACLDEIDQSDLFVGVYAHRYGYVPDRVVATVVAIINFILYLPAATAIRPCSIVRTLSLVAGQGSLPRRGVSSRTNALMSLSEHHRHQAWIHAIQADKDVGETAGRFDRPWWLQPFSLPAASLDRQDDRGARSSRTCFSPVSLTYGFGRLRQHATSAHQPDDEEHDGDDQEHMNECPDRVGSDDPEQPRDQQNDS
jgi:uncharacterized protein DUF4062